MSLAAVCIIIIAAILMITCLVFYVNREDVRRFIICHIEEFRLQFITPRSKLIGVSSNMPSSRILEKIDTNHHMLPPVYLEHVKQQPDAPSDLDFPTWSPQISLEFMTRNSISTSILSFTHTTLHDVSICREINIYAHNLSLQHPTKFGFFATLPAITESSLSDVLSSLKFCHEKLHPEGFTLLTSYDGKYLGHELFRPIWQELNRINAVVLIHPIDKLLSPPSPHPSLIPPMVDFTHETSRTAFSLIYSNVLPSCPNVRIILSHAGGTLPYISARVASLTYDEGLSLKTPKQFMKEAKSFYTDWAGSSYHGPVGYTEKWLGPGKTTYGSGFPLVQEKTIVRELGFLESWVDRNEEEGKAVTRETALSLFPRLKHQIQQVHASKKHLTGMVKTSRALSDMEVGELNF
ncbi:hypothetical protein DSL72_008916 [Monilinia vaccinii-corymbosi]|uniref:6-methylsalicylate decarboxylase n=1 Tax=Monilinia vaccinii-corymbosi TaxID=61207 RepID=A0A8A3PSU2_9HELO|nr:hypothetical protein DSL72_008916 [Monilinia vaccinii-corymbosi]